MQEQKSTSSLKLFLAWAFVGVPLVWGIVKTLGNAVKLFQ